MSAILILLGLLCGPRAERLMERALALPDVRADLVVPAVEAALEVETPELSAELLIAIAWGETRLDPAVRTGRVCGIAQVNPADIGRPRSDCAAWSRDARAGFAAGVHELEVMLADARVRGSVRRALLYRACGNAAFDGTCRKKAWPAWVLRRAAALKETRCPTT